MNTNTGIGRIFLAELNRRNDTSAEQVALDTAQQQLRDIVVAWLDTYCPPADREVLQRYGALKPCGGIDIDWVDDAAVPCQGVRYSNHRSIAFAGYVDVPGQIHTGWNNRIDLCHQSVVGTVPAELYTAATAVVHADRALDAAKALPGKLLSNMTKKQAIVQWPFLAALVEPEPEVPAGVGALKLKEV